MNDLVSDFVARVNNARLAEKTEVVVIKNKFVASIANKLTKLGYFKEYKDGENHDLIISFDPKRIESIKRLSKPGQRTYNDSKAYPTIIGGIGYVLVTTSKGVLTHVEAAKQGIGGELILEIY